jgi:RNA-directed DNA polymerase
MNELDQFMKHSLRVKHYARYTDDFVVISSDHVYLERLLPEIEAFLGEHLHLSLHPDKVNIRKYRQGVDFLGYVILPHCILPRAKTLKRMFRKMRRKAAQHHAGLIDESKVESSLQSYLGVLSHANAHDTSEKLKNEYWLYMKRDR